MGSIYDDDNIDSKERERERERELRGTEGKAEEGMEGKPSR